LSAGKPRSGRAIHSCQPRIREEGVGRIGARSSQTNEPANLLSFPYPVFLLRRLRAATATTGVGNIITRERAGGAREIGSDNDVGPTPA
jgi:hypothetical protein